MPENQNIHQFSLKKSERLCSKKSIDLLFEKGSSAAKGCIRLIYLEGIENQESSCQVMISVSKRRFKRAVDRNKVKRLIREIYRLNKIQLNEIFLQQNKKLIFAIVYQSNEILPYGTIETDLKKMLQKLIIKVQG